MRKMAVVSLRNLLFLSVTSETRWKSSATQIRRKILKGKSSTLRKYIPKLDENFQITKMSVTRATNVKERFDVMDDDLNSLVNRLQRLLPLCIERKTEFFLPVSLILSPNLSLKLSFTLSTRYWRKNNFHVPLALVDNFIWEACEWEYSNPTGYDNCPSKRA